MNNKRIFPALLANEAIKSLCGKDVLLGRSSHAYIIDGPRGSGKHTAAMQIAASILCTEKANESAALPCGRCASCKKVFSGYSTSVETVSRGDAASLQVDVIRKMLSTVSYLPEDGDRKIYIIDDAHKMTVPAQNSLLLTLEEPPPHAVFILLTTDSGALLETVRSRAMILKTQQLSPEAIYKELLMRADMGKLPSASSDKLKEASAAAEGCLGRAIEYCFGGESAALKARRSGLLLADALLFSSPAEAAIFCRELDGKRAEYDEIFTYAMSFVRDYIALKSGSDATLVTVDISEAKRKASSLSHITLGKVFASLSEAREDIVRRNASPQCVLATLAAAASK